MMTRINFNQIKGNVLNVLDYGAAADITGANAAANYTAFTAAIAAAAALGKSVFVPAGSYVVSNTLVISHSMSLIGESAVSTDIRGLGFSVGQYVIDIDGDPSSTGARIEGVEISNLTIMGFVGGTAPNLIRMKNVADSIIRNVFLRECRYGVTLAGTATYNLLFERIVGYATPLVRTVTFDNYQGGGNLTFESCNFTGTIGVYVDATSTPRQMSFLSCNWEACTQQGFYSAGDAWSTSFIGCRFEKNGAPDIQFDPAAAVNAYGITISGCWFDTDVVVTAPIVFGGSGGGQVRGFAVFGNYAQDYADSLVFLNGEGQSGYIMGNRMKTTPAAVNPSAGRPGVLVANNESNVTTIGPNLILEDGIWTPTNVSAGGTTGITGAAGQYTRIGRQVFFQGTFQLTGAGTANPVLIGGLPYDVLAGAGTQGRAGGIVNSTDLGAAAGILLGVSNAKELSLITPTTGAAINTNTASTKYFYVSGSYAV